MTNRREFLKNTIWAGALLYASPRRLLSLERAALTLDSVDFPYRYKTVSVSHVREVGEWMSRLDRDGKLSGNETFRKYIGAFVYEYEKVAADAKSLIVLAIPQNIISVVFRKGGQAYEVITPSGYFSDGLKRDDIMARLKKDILKGPGAVLYPGPRLPLKTFAVRSGLAKYGRNNITYVEGEYGSVHRLGGYYTNMELPDNWGPVLAMKKCQNCMICRSNCPTKAIGTDNFVIDVGKCITLYNETSDPMPAWVDAKAHNALAGCNRCQEKCPGNTQAYKRIERLAELDEAETECILSLSQDKALQESVVRKLNRFLGGPEDIAYLSQNLKLVLPNVSAQSA